MATQPRSAVNIQHARPTHSTAKEKEHDRRAQQVAHADPQADANAAKREQAKEDGLPVQQGMSSSELNTTHPAMKEQATKEAADKPVNTSPDGEQKAGTDQAKTGFEDDEDKKSE